ncbi:MAG: phosphoglucosamine mutase [Firmicutes bacterium]|nr:phosphoglucosamine mutase [Bacillota bacterium]
MAKRFGTDGVRGVANTVLTPELAFDLGRAGAYVLARHKAAGEKIRILVGKDTRLSGDLLANALLAGILSVGADAYLVDVVPTPAVAWLTLHQSLEAGVMISASHNPAADNGIKFFACDGCKLPDELEDEIEYWLDHSHQLPRPAGDQVGRVHHVFHWSELYVDYLANLATVPSFHDLHVVLDCANGAAFQVAPTLFTRLGIRTEVINAAPNGLNINVECGSTHPNALSQKVQEVGADLGLAFDGDADRLIAVDHEGRVVNGDAIMAICALALKAEGHLTNDLLVTTVMSNLGLEKAMEAAGIRLLRTQVGDRYVLAAMQEAGASLGGEQSGHIIFLDHATTGDGVLTALKLVEIVAKNGMSLADLAAVVKPYPQVLLNVPVANRDILQEVAVTQAIQQAEQMMQGQGRLLVRPSGTEPVIRVMAEAATETLAETAVQLVARVIEQVNEQEGK